VGAAFGCGVCLADPLRLLLWYWGRRGGGAQFTLGLARALAARGDVTLGLALSSGNELLGEYKALNCRVMLTDTYNSRASFLRALPRIPAARRVLADQAREADLVVSTMTHLWTPFVAPYLPVPYVPVVHEARPHLGDSSLLWSWRLQKELQAASAFVALSDGVATDLRDFAPSLPCLRLRLLALPRRPQQAIAGPPCFLFFGRLRAYKGLDLLRDAFAILQKIEPAAVLRVVGEGNIETCAPGLSQQPGVTVESRWVPECEVASLLGSATAIVLPYYAASQSGIVPQAQALGVPVIATPVAGLREQLRDGCGAIFADEPTPAAFARAMREVLVPATIARLREEARNASTAAVDWVTEATALVEGLRPLVKRCRDASLAQ
jgi:glycosyltransferase involved in cell wall biosynthesis